MSNWYHSDLEKQILSLDPLIAHLFLVWPLELEGSDFLATPLTNDKVPIWPSLYQPAICHQHI